LGKNPDIPHLIKEVVKAKEDFYRYFDDPNMPSSNWIVFEALRKALKIEKYRSRIITLQDKISAFIDQHHAELHEFQRIHITGKASEGAERSTKTERSDHEEDKEHTSEVTGDAGFRNV
jgi:hypothetical protein